MTAPPKLSLRGVTKRFGDKVVLDGVDLDVQAGRSLVIIGGSGQGKSVTIKIAIGLMPPDAGQVLVDGQDVTGLKGAAAQAHAGRFGMLFQGAALFDSLPVWENVAFRLLNADRVPRRQARERAMDALAKVRLPADAADLYPVELSGGMQKRVGLARAVVANPEIIFFDEPTTGLDPITADVINDLIAEQVKRLGCTAVSITHDMASARKIGDEIAMLHAGRIVWRGPAAEIDRSGNAYVDQFINGRARGRSRARTNPLRRLLPAILAASLVSTILVFLAASIGRPSDAVAARIPPPDFVVGETAEGDIWLRGRVGPGMLNQFARVRPKQGRRVILTSSGGSAGDGVAIARIILDNGMHTVVRGACYSSCANYLFFAGATKTVEPGGMIGFHGWPRIATAADRERVAAAIQRRRPQATQAEIDVAFEQFQAKSAADMALQTDFYARIGSPRLPRLMRILDADPVDYPTGRPYRGGLAIVPTQETLERCFGVKGIVAYSRPAQVQKIDWASDRAPTSGADLQLVWTRDPAPDCSVFDRAGSEARPSEERQAPPTRTPQPASRAGAQRGRL